MVTRRRPDYTQPSATRVSATVERLPSRRAASSAASGSGKRAVQNEPVVSLAARAAAAFRRLRQVPKGKRRCAWLHRAQSPISTPTPSTSPGCSAASGAGIRQQAHRRVMDSVKPLLELQFLLGTATHADFWALFPRILLDQQKAHGVEELELQLLARFWQDIVPHILKNLRQRWRMEHVYRTIATAASNA